MEKFYFLTQVIMVPLYQLQGNLLILVVLAIQLSVLILNIMIFKIQFIHKCLQLLYLNSIQRWKDYVFFFKIMQIWMPKNSHHDIRIWPINHLPQRSQGSIFMANTAWRPCSFFAFVPRVYQGSYKVFTPRELLEFILSGWHQECPLLMVFPPLKSRWFYNLQTLKLNKGCISLRVRVGRDIKYWKPRCEKNSVLHGKVVKW